MHTHDVRAAARALNGDVSGRDGVVCPGPGHSPQDRSLSVRFDPNAPDGFVVHSFAGDDPIICKDHVRERLGIEAFKPNGKLRAADSNAKPAISSRGVRIVATYVYTEPYGAPLYRVCRLASKKFIQERADGRGGWLPGLNGQRTVPYRWPELANYPDATVFICEGEKDADRVASLGACATTISGSAKWTEETVAALTGRDCLILEDNDETGREKALAAAHALYGQAKSVRIVRLPGLAERGDVSDWLDADTTRGIDELTAACFEAPLWVQLPKSGLPFIDMSKWDAEPAPPREWAIQDCVPLRQPTIFSGESAVGKSLLDLMRSVAHVLGKSWLGKVTEPGPAIYLGAEDEESELHRRLATIVAHYDATFADAIAGGLHMLSYAGQDAVPGVPNARGIIEPTSLFMQLREAALAGQMADAEEPANTLVQHGRTTAQPGAEGWGLYFLAMTRASQHLFDEADKLVRTSVSLAKPRQMVSLLARCELLQAQIALALTEPIAVHLREVAEGHCRAIGLEAWITRTRFFGANYGQQSNWLQAAQTLR